VRDILPAPVYEAIEAHITDKAGHAHEGWPAGSDEEDTLTGDLGATFRTPWSPPISMNGDTWSWRITYKKFRGRGPGAFERSSGADGIFQVEVTLGSQMEFKGLLFQAKKMGQMNGELQSQVERMERMAPRGSAVFVYGPESYRAVPGHDYLAQASLDRSAIERALQPLGEFLGRDFLSCIHGLRGMHYDAARGLLFLPNGSAYHISVAHRIRIEASRLT
jgi:hypothetical protein